MKVGNATYLYTLILIKLCHILLQPLAVVITSPVHHGDLSHFGHHKLGYASSYHSIIYTERTALSAPLLLHSLEYPRNVNEELITELGKLKQLQTEQLETDSLYGQRQFLFVTTHKKVCLFPQGYSSH